jgi:hypothetical protein
MYTRVTTYNVDPSKIDEAIAGMEGIKNKIQSISGLQICISSMQSSGRGVVTAVYDGQESADAALPVVREVWSKFGDLLLGAPDSEGYEMVEDMLS